MSFYRKEGEVVEWVEGRTDHEWNYRDRLETLRIITNDAFYWYGQQYPEDIVVPQLDFLSGRVVRFGFSTPSTPFTYNYAYAKGKNMFNAGEVVQIYYLRSEK
ncbi:hypothetical protein ACFOPQ_18490 [Deinococcus antarcticus]|uniref:Uncharacterized protein n=1 Tax=Deinococcus antarcticus TaxID=1298767 RepID=A0ABV8AC01_9DEIO